MATVLLIEDSSFARAALREIIEVLGHTVAAQATDGEEGVALYKKLQPDVVTMDITMPKLDGIEAIRQIRTFDPKAKIIVCSVMGRDIVVREAIAAGACDFILKPFNTERIAKAIEKVLRA